MQLFIWLALLIAIGFFWARRASTPRDRTLDLAGTTREVARAARRLGFQRQRNLHPVESIEDDALAIAAIATAFFELGDPPAAGQRTLLAQQVRAGMHADASQSEDMAVLVQWLITECGGPEPAIARISRKLYLLNGSGPAATLLDMLTSSLDPAAWSSAQRDAFEDIKRALRLS